MNIAKTKFLTQTLLLFFLFVFLFLFSVNITLAQTSLLEDSGDTKYSAGCISDGNCTLNDFVTIGIRVSQIILGVVGSLALLAFVYGGVVWLLSGGSSEKVTRGKQVMIGAVIGLFIVFASYTIMRFVATALGVSGDIFTTGVF